MLRMGWYPFEAVAEEEARIPQIFLHLGQRQEILLLTLQLREPLAADACEGRLIKRHHKKHRGHDQCSLVAEP